MSMNFSQRIGLVSALLAAVAAAPIATAQGTQAKSSYYQTISIDSVLRTKPAIIYVSSKYQVTLMVNGREITGVSLELSKQKLFSVTLAENHRMIFLDSLTSRGQADLNLVLDDEQVLPVHLIVRDVPTGTRIYTFETADETEEAEAPAPAAKPPVAASPAPKPPAKQPVAPAPAPQPVQQPAPSPVAPPNTAKPSAPVAAQPKTSGSNSSQARIGSSVPAAPPISPAATTATYSNVKMAVEFVKFRDDATLTLRLTSPTGQALRADVNHLRLYDGTRPVPYTVEQGAKGRLLPVDVTLKVQSVPANLMVYWPVTSIAPIRQYTLRTRVKVD